MNETGIDLMRIRAREPWPVLTPEQRLEALITYGPCHMCGGPLIGRFVEEGDDIQYGGYCADRCDV